MEDENENLYLLSIVFCIAITSVLITPSLSKAIAITSVLSFFSIYLMLTPPSITYKQ